MKSILNHFLGSIICIYLNMFLFSEVAKNNKIAITFIEATVIPLLGWLWWIWLFYSIFMIIYTLFYVPIKIAALHFLWNMSFEEIWQKMDRDFFYTSM